MFPTPPYHKSKIRTVEHISLWTWIFYFDFCSLFDSDYNLPSSQFLADNQFQRKLVAKKSYCIELLSTANNMRAAIEFKNYFMNQFRINLEPQSISACFSVKCFINTNIRTDTPKYLNILFY